MSVLARMLAQTGKSAVDFRANSILGNIARKQGVPDSAELQRIIRIPRRSWEDIPQGGYLERLSEHLRLPGSSGMLRPAQVAALTEVYDYGGSLGVIGLGHGKTHITALTPTLTGAQRPVLVAPAKLREKTARDFKRIRQDWIVHPRIEFISYEQLSRIKGRELLEHIQPDLLMCDEVHALARLDSGRTKVIRRYMRQHPETIFVGLSGTISNRSLKQFWHLLMWALKPELMPLPRNWKELELWAAAVDEKVAEEDRVAPGALLLLANHLPDTDDAPLVRARQGLRDRLRSTPGYVATVDTGVEASISLELVKPRKSAVVEEALIALRDTKMTPNGIECVTPMELWRYARTIGCGFYYEWVPPAPEEWLVARKNWTRYVRHALDGSTKYDTPEQVAAAVTRGHLDTPFSWEDKATGKTLKAHPRVLQEAWQGIRPTYEYQVEPRWLDEAYMRWIVAEFMKPKDEPMIFWTEHVAIGQKLHELSGAPYCRERGLDGRGRFIEDLAGQHVIASVKGCGEGTNLQPWHRNFVISCEPVGRTWEQMVGRTHRAGQLADNVEILVLVACHEQEAGFEQAVADCRFKYQTEGQIQRLLLADRV